MITIIIFAVIGLYMGIAEAIDCIRLGVNIVTGFILACLLAMAGSLIGAIIGVFIAVAIPTKTHIVESTYDLELLNDRGSMNGSFFLGSGSFEGSMQYVYYYKDDGFYKMNQVAYDISKVRYSNKPPRVDVYKEEIDYDYFFNMFSIPLFLTDEYVFNVPEGSINQSYRLDGN